MTGPLFLLAALCILTPMISAHMAGVRSDADIIHWITNLKIEHKIFFGVCIWLGLMALALGTAFEIYKVK